MSPAVHRLTLSEHLSRHYAKSMVNMMDQNTKDSTSGKSGANEVSSHSNASDTCPIHPNAQVDAYSSAMVVHQPNDGLDNNDLEAVEISDKCCPVNVVDKDCVFLSRQVCTFGLILSLSLPVSMISLTKAALIVWSANIKHLIIVSMIEARFPAWSVKV
jgi:uncharacterized protein (UPF0212 family)